MAFGWFATPERNAAGPGPDSVGIQRQGAKPPRRNRIFFMTKPGNQESSKKSHGFLPSLCGIVFGRAFAPLRLCVKSFWYGGRRQRPGRGRIQPECNVKAQSRQDATGFFYCETRKPRIIGKISWFPDFLMELFLVAPLRLCAFASLR
jgi:hypothetical protein